ncbi:MAG: 4-hydroxy-tetrahydrodipicolinate reductase [Deltaproteobacteria bacterium]|nr:4-hydroxy-tetrahydrodipicolinate reductase [Deltaproteobacteria bacterium]
MTLGATQPPPPGLVIIGARGRMGQRIAALAPQYDLDVAWEVDVDGPALDADVARSARCVIDFSTVGQARATLAFCAEFGVPAVLGTTGLGPEEEEALARAARSVPLVWAPNFSLGVHVLQVLVTEAARLLDERWDVELVEAHHRRKVDAPSGTALALAQRVAAARGAGLSEIARYGREGQVGARPRGEIGIHAVRGGTVVGEHTLSFLGEGETVTLSHQALDRDVFVRGALSAASWLLAAPRLPGRYDLSDVLRRD